MIDPRCILSSIRGAILGWLWTGIRIVGHNFTTTERWSHCVVHVIRCDWCGKYEVMWERTGESKYAPYHDEQMSAAEITFATTRQEAARG